MNLTLLSRTSILLVNMTVLLALLSIALPTGSQLLGQELAPESATNSTATSVGESSSPQTDVSDETIQKLFEQLDSPSFDSREFATEQLINRGPEILKPLTVHFFNSSSEAGWRIHRILEGIGRSGNENDFLKSVAIIQLLYGAQDRESQARLAGLQFQWMSTRRTEASRKLSRQGFQFSAPSGPTIQNALADRVHIERMIRAVEIRELGGIEIATAANPIESKTANNPTPNKWINPRLDRQKSILKAEKIINGSAEDNRDLVQSTLAPSFRATLPPGTLQLPKGWEPNEETLKLINDLGPLSSLVFEEQSIDTELQKFISRQKSLTRLGLINCKFDDESKKLSLPSSIVNLELSGSLPDPASFRSLDRVRNLKLSKVKLDEDIAYAISRRQIQMIDLEEVEFTRMSIKHLANMRGLFRISMSLCQFELQWFKDIRKKNSKVIVAAPKALLGVRGPFPATGNSNQGCMISQVEPDKAAAAAGLRELDIVTAVDGTKIDTFEDLRLMISQKRPGDSMSIEVQRGKENLKLQVELGEMPASMR